MAVDQPSSPLTQAIRSVRWVVNSLNHPLASLTLPLDSLDWDDAALPLVEFDPLAQFSPPAAPEQTTTDHTRSAQKPQSGWVTEPLSVSEFSNELSEHFMTSSAAAPATPVFSLRPRASESAARSPLDPPFNGVGPSNSVGKPVYKLRPGTGAEPQLRQALSTEVQSNEERQNGDRPLLAQPSGSPLTDVSPVLFSIPAGAAAIAEPAVTITTVTMIEQVVNQLLSSSTYAAAATNPTTSAPIATAYSTVNPTDLTSFHLSPSPSPMTTSSTSIPLPIARSVIDLMSGNWMDESAQPAIAPTSQTSGFDAGFDIPDFASPTAETSLAEMAETLTLLVNDVLSEQARRHGVDLS